MKAEEVRKMMAQREAELSSQDKVLYDKIMAEITDKVKNASDKVDAIYWTGKMTSYVRHHLEKDGFTVTFNSSFRSDDSSYTISWKKPTTSDYYNR